MANFSDSPNWEIHDDYYTKKSTWELITPFIPQDKTIWEFCLLNSNEQSKQYLQELGYNVVGDRDVDFLINNIDADILVSNIPFSTEIKIKIMKRLVELDRPFIFIMNSLNIFTKYFKEIFGDKHIQLIYPTHKIHYTKFVDGQLINNYKTSFYSVFVSYKIVDKDTWI